MFNPHSTIVPTREITRLSGVMPRRLRQIVAGNTGEMKRMWD